MTRVRGDHERREAVALDADIPRSTGWSFERDGEALFDQEPRGSKAYLSHPVLGPRSRGARGGGTPSRGPLCDRNLRLAR